METLNAIAYIFLAVGIICLIIIIIDLFSGYLQQIMVMNLVWPITTLYAGPLALLAYYKIGRLSTKMAMMEAKMQDKEMPSKQKPFWQSVAVGALRQRLHDWRYHSRNTFDFCASCCFWG